MESGEEAAATRACVSSQTMTYSLRVTVICSEFQNTRREEALCGDAQRSSMAQRLVRSACDRGS
jgi:hypothetical protein